MKRRVSLVLATALAVCGLRLEAATPPVAPRCAPSTTTTVSNTSGAPVPDNGTLVRQVTVGGAGPFIWDVDVVLNVPHSNSADLDITLTSPAGAVITLSTDNGGSNDNVFAGTRFDDQAGTPVTDVTFANNVAVVTATPEQPLARLYGENPNGVWTLQVADDAAGNTGSFVEVTLIITTVPTLPTEVRRRVTLAPGTAIADLATTVSAQVVRGGGSFVRRVELNTSISHTFASDLDVTLTSPSGTVVTLTTDNGSLNDNVFNGTRWFDRAPTRVTDATYTNGVVASPLSPEEPLAAFVGGPANGTWTLSIADDVSGDVGTLASWTLDVFTASCGATPAAPPGFAPPTNTTHENTTPRAVPSSGLVTSSIVVAGAAPYLWDVDVTTFLRHTWSADLDVRLVSPQGTEVRLTTGNGGSLDNVFNGTRWDDQGDLPATDALYENAVPQRTLVPESALGAFIGENPNGVWTLRIFDVIAGDDGTLDRWSLDIAGLPAAPGASGVPLIFSTPAGIPDGTQSGLVRTSAVSGLGDFLTRARLTTAIVHPSPGQLEIFLTSPAGTTATISTGNGGANANVFNGTTWRDLAAALPVTDATYGTGVAQTTLVPEEAMSAFIGENPNGVWTLTILDTVTGQAGTLSSWGLQIETGAAWNLTQSLTAAPAGVAAGGPLTYTATVGSAGPGDAIGPLTFSLPLAVTTRFTSITAPAGWTCSTPAVGATGTISCTRAGNLPVGQTQVLTVQVSVAPGTAALTQIVATANVASGSAEINVADNTATATTLVVQPTAGDTDGDSLPDAWESQFGLDPNAVTGNDGPFADVDGDGVSNAQELANGTHPRGFHSRYFAEGATSGFFDTRFALLNRGSDPARTLLRFLRAGASAIGHPLTVAATSRATVNAKAVPGMAAAEFATVVESDQPLIADRTMTWDAGGYGSHAETSVAAPSTRWYLAEGATHSGFQLFYLLQNANPAPATVSIEYLLPSGAPITQEYVVPANSRETVWVNTINATLASTDVSATIDSDLPIIVERAMYLNRPGQMFAAGHESAGVTTPSTGWFLAEGATGPYFDLFVLIANPSNTLANITARFLRVDGTVVTRSYQVQPKARFNIWVDQEGPELADAAVSTTIQSDVPVLVERAMWWPGSADTWHEAHNSFGATDTGTAWALAEGEQGGAATVETYVLIANTSDFAGEVRVRLYLEDGTTLVRTFPVTANSRLNVPIGAAESDGGFGPANVNGRRFGVVVESLVPAGGTEPAAIVVERAMYGNAGGLTWAAGSNALATRLF